MDSRQDRQRKKETAWTRLRKFSKTPKAYALSVLTLLTLVAGLAPGMQGGLVHAAEAVGTAIVFDGLVAWVLRRPATFSVGGIITALIVADVLSRLTPWYVVVLTTLIALLSKHVLKRGRKPIFNPAAVGLLVSLGLFSTAQSWWAGMPLLSWWHVVLLLAAGVFVAVRVRKYTQVLVFLGTYLILLFGMALLHLGLPSATPADALRTPFINAALFFGFFMLTDPPTTPGSLRGQVQFSVIVAAVAVLLFSQVGGLAYLFAGLLAGNLWTLWLARARRSDNKPSRNPAHSVARART